MKISPSDRIQALKRSAQYAEDYKRHIRDCGEEYHLLHGSPQALSMKLSESAKSLCEKYDLRYPIDPEEPFEKFEIDYAFPIISFLDAPESWREVENIDLTVDQNEMSITHVNGKLVCMIDTRYSKEEIKKAFADFLDMSLISWGKREKSRVKESVIDDIWKVYDMKKDEDKNLLQITHELFKINDLPAYNEQADLYYKRVTRAYKKACQIIRSIETAAQ